jgi:hypothetical protein
MNQFQKYLLKSFLYNLLAGIVLMLPLTVLKGNDATIGWLFALLVIAPLSLLVQLIVGIVYASVNKNKELGKAMILTVGIFLLIGLGICGSMAL